MTNWKNSSNRLEKFRYTSWSILSTFYSLTFSYITLCF
ncbi:hypothetical protein TSAR_012150 [Trichomalopsis sarcophagae]|uniref:Uncharacterized protein n=1 Tax=Trichomalopsis sarcophagae TaxID=543379 RepID=A0A232FLB8_9HYME|nr:hypothetical protein TSAR_012150 [Trichomalopsis sarcophagae]